MCGAVTFTATDVPNEFSSCHCKTCLRWVGNAYKGVNVPTENIVFSGGENIRTFASSAFAERANCTKCGSAIWWKLTAGPYVGKTSISLGLLDDTDGMVLSSELFVDFKNSTDEVPEGVSQMTSEEAAKIVADFV
jgi:hypothetical protein